MEIQHRQAIDAFCLELSKWVPCRVKLLLTGGVGALLLGSNRPTGDVHFGLTVATTSQAHVRQWGEVEAAIAAASEAAGITVQYSADIDRWSSITMPNYQRHTRLYRRFGRVWVYLLEPVYWAIPKLARYPDTDGSDLESVLRAQEVEPEALARLCGRALRASLRSTAQFSFRQHVEHSFRSYGPSLWGSGFDAEAAVRVFRRAAGIRAGRTPA